MKSSQQHKNAFLIISIFLPALCFSQIEFSLKLNYDSTKWGVFARPTDEISPSQNTITGSGQVTVVAPHGFEWSGMKNVAGIWFQNARADAPVENPQYDYISVGLSSDNPKILYQTGFETLLFSFDRVRSDCPDTLFLISDDDPFSKPNSLGSNPNNEIFIIDTDRNGVSYGYTGNYDLCAWSCRECDPGKIGGETSSIEKPNRPAQKINLYPNPATNILHIFSEVQPIEVLITDFLGNAVLHQKSSSDPVDISKIPAGIFYVHLKLNERDFQTEKIQIIK